MTADYSTHRLREIKLYIVSSTAMRVLCNLAIGYIFIVNKYRIIAGICASGVCVYMRGRRRWREICTQNKILYGKFLLVLT